MDNFGACAAAVIARAWGRRRSSLATGRTLFASSYAYCSLGNMADAFVTSTVLPGQGQWAIVGYDQRVALIDETYLFVDALVGADDFGGNLSSIASPTLAQQELFTLLAGMVGTGAFGVAFGFLLDEVQNSEPSPADGPIFLPLPDIVTPVNTEAGFLLATVLAQDEVGLADEPYSLIGPSVFTIDPASGRVFMPSNVPQGVHSLVIQALNSEGRSSQAALQITIASRDDHDPQLELSADVANEHGHLFFFSSESSFVSTSNLSGDIVAAIIAEDDYDVRFELDDDRFAISDDGVIRIAQSASLQEIAAAVSSPAASGLNAMAMASSQNSVGDAQQALSDGVYTVTVTATDVAGNSTSHSVRIRIDTTAPDLSGTVTMATVNGSTDHQSDLLTINSNGEAGLSYRLEDANNQASTLFTIGDDGIVRLIENASPSEGDHSVTVIATDAAGNSTSHAIVITVNTVISITTEFLNNTEFVETAAGAEEVRFTVADFFDPTDNNYQVSDGDNLPNGLTLDETTGYLTGTLALTSIFTAEVFSFSVDAFLDGEVQRNATFAFDVGVNLVPEDLTPYTGYTIRGSNGDDHVVAGAHFSARRTSTLDLLDGDNIVTLGAYTRFATVGSKITINAGDGNDTVTLGNHMTWGSGSRTSIDLGAGDNIFSAGSYIGYDRGILTLETGDGNDTINFGGRVAFQSNASATLNTGGGADRISLGDMIGGNSGWFTLDSGNGDDTVQFGQQIGLRGGQLDLTLGQGQDQLILGGSSVGANISLDLFDGVEAGADLVIFQGSISGLSIQDFGNGDMLVFPTGQIFDELNENIPTATIDGLTNDGTQTGQMQIGVSFDAPVEAALVQRTLTYSVFDNGTWSERTEEFSVVTLEALI